MLCQHRRHGPGSAGPSSPLRSCNAIASIAPIGRISAVTPRRASGRRSPADGGYRFAYWSDDLTGTVIWRPELTAVTVILDSVPEGFTGAAIDPHALGGLLADQAGLDGRHIVVADSAGEHRLWLRDPTPGRPLAAIVPLDKDFVTRIASLLRFHRRLFGKKAGPQPRGWPLTAYKKARLPLMLCALDLRLGGATYREIAVALGKDEAAHLSATEWKDSAARSFVYRLVRDATAMMNGDYRKLLRIR
ncbi:MAG: DUF2285 domain-containing protein [Alphaproteobacteria bacterium]|nr:DUF2285 domain-containing protein [Alphaproteobacteria bacterium]